MAKDTTNDELARMIKTGFDEVSRRFDETAKQGDVDRRFDNVHQELEGIHVELRHINNRLDSVDTYVVQQRALIRILRDNKTITPKQAQELGVN